MTDPILLRSCADLTLANAERLAFDGARLELTEEATRTMAQGRERFEKFLSGAVGGYVYGSTTAPGARAKVLLSAADAARQSESVGNFLLLQGGVGGEMLAARCVRLAVLSRLSNALSGAGKLRPETAEQIARMADDPPPVPLRSSACSGEVIPLTWLMAPLARLPLAMGEAMALVNGSPFASAMLADVAMTLRRRVRLAEWVFALSCEAAGCPAAHFDPRLADLWPDPYYRESLRRLGALLEGSQRRQLSHQAPTSWRVLPNVLASTLQALEECATAAGISLRALKDNPTFLAGEDGSGDSVASSGGYHDHRAGKAIDMVNNVMLDVDVLASRQISRFLDGEALGLPPLLAMPGDLAGIEYAAWGLTESLVTAKRAAEPTNLDIGVHDPAGNQSDVTSLAFSAYVKHRDAARAWDDCLASLAIIAVLALQFSETPLPPRLRRFCDPLLALVSTAEHRAAACAQPLRQVRELLRHAAEEMSTAGFDALF
jgi:histidine ammonia-lyase